MEKWETFKGKFQILRDRVEDWTPQEEYKNLTQSLPRKWMQEVVKAATQSKRRTFHVRITNMPTIQPREIKHRLERQIKEDLEAVVALPHGYQVHCKDALSQEKVLQLNGTLVEEKPIRCVRIEKELSGDEIFSHILLKLEQEELVNQMLANAKNKEGVQVHALAPLEKKRQPQHRRLSSGQAQPHPPAQGPQGSQRVILAPKGKKKRAKGVTIDPQAGVEERRLTTSKRLLAEVLHRKARGKEKEKE